MNTGTLLYYTPALGGYFQQSAIMVSPDGMVLVPDSQNDAQDALIAYQDTGSGLVEKWRVPIPYLASVSMESRSRKVCRFWVPERFV